MNVYGLKSWSWLGIIIKNLGRQIICQLFSKDNWFNIYYFYMVNQRSILMALHFFSIFKSIFSILRNYYTIEKMILRWPLQEKKVARKFRSSLRTGYVLLLTYKSIVSNSDNEELQTFPISTFKMLVHVINPLLCQKVTDAVSSVSIND